MLVAEIIRWNQPEVYSRLLDYICKEVVIGTGYSLPDEDELPEFKYYKRLMEERKAVAL